MPQPLPAVRNRMVAQIDRWAISKPNWRKFGRALKYLAPVVTAATFPAISLLAEGAHTLTGLFVYLALGAATGTLGSRSLSRSFNETATLRIAASNIGEKARELNAAKAELKAETGQRAEQASRISELQRQKGKLIEGMKGAYGEEVDIEQMLGLHDAAFDGHNIFRKVLGVGGMAVAVLVHNIDMDAQKVFKIPKPDLLGNPMHLARFKSGEAKSMLELNHPNVVRFFTLSYMSRENYLELLRLCKMEEYEALKSQPALIPETVPFIEMEYVEGETLMDRMTSQPFTPQEAVRLAIIMAETLEHVHHKGIIHRDLKPENIFVTPDEYDPGQITIKIGDFGLAKVTEGEGRSASMNLTQAGEVFGTPQYMSPEQCKGVAVGWQSDQYAVGVLLFEMISGRLPFGKTDDMVNQRDLYNYIGQVMTKPAPLVTEFSPVPEKLATVIARMLATETEQRFPSWRDCVDALRGVFTAEDLPNDATAIAEVGPDGEIKRRG